MSAAAARVRRSTDAQGDPPLPRQLQWSKLTKLQARLREDLERPRIKVSEAANDLIGYIDAAEEDQLVTRPHRSDDHHLGQAKKKSIGSFLRCG